ncbi:MAG: hypothetical protein CMJ81_18165 [Planctomycetaceae bacterium]|nr:hypothetical protein [Planctomycetaceae bacterium]
MLALTCRAHLVVTRVEPQTWHAGSDLHLPRPSSNTPGMPSYFPVSTFEIRSFFPNWFMKQWCFWRQGVERTPHFWR